MSAGEPWYVADPASARMGVELEGLLALFHRPSGQTHLLAPPAPEILAALAEGPADAATLLERLARTHEIEGGVAAIAARLAELEAGGLAWSI